MPFVKLFYLMNRSYITFRECLFSILYLDGAIRDLSIKLVNEYQRRDKKLTMMMYEASDIHGVLILSLCLPYWDISVIYTRNVCVYVAFYILPLCQQNI